MNWNANLPRLGALAVWVTALACALRMAAQSRPEPPDFVAFQGALIAADGTPIGGTGAVNYPMVFRVFTSPTGGTPLWSEQQTATVRNGAFSVVLGEGSAFRNEPRPPLSSVFLQANASERFIEMTVLGAGAGEADATVSPRTQFVSGGYGLLATRARTAQEMVNREGTPLLRPVGDKVGINKGNPQATLDVAGSMVAGAWAVRQTLTVGGSGEAEGFHGLGMAPVGAILMWTGSTPPAGWVLCDGSVVGGVRTPDLRGRFVLAAGPRDGIASTAREMHQRGGEEAHALTQSELPSHSHGVSFSGVTSEATESSHSYRTATSGVSYERGNSSLNTLLGTNKTRTGGYHVHSYDVPAVQSSGRGQARPHNTMPPFYVLAFIIRVR